MKHKQDIYKKPKIPMKEILTRMTISVFLLGFISFEISAYFKKIPTLDTLELPTVTFDSENLAQESLMKMPQSELKTVAKNDVDQEDMRLEQQESQENESTEKENVEKNSSQSANSSSVIEIDAEQAKEKEKTLIKMMRANDDPHQLFGTVSLMQKILKENDAYKTQELVFGYEYFSPEDKAAILTKEIKANHPTTVTKLLDEGFLLIQPYDKANQLIFKRQYKMAILLLKRKIIPATAKNRFGYTLLHEAAAKGHATLIRLLVSLGADINAQANDGASALHYPSH
ncbi:MAG: ankyrin repeat domain-containing protein, partial [Thiovulaceae bacterium]|nr:ankyrin repeat domain-containing protein [Sulfurimonadaceae bacterium]